MIKNLVFDFGGIIADFEFSRALAAFERVGLKNPAEYLDSYHQRGFFRELESGRIGADEFVRRLGECAGREVSYAEAREAWFGPGGWQEPLHDRVRGLIGALATSAADGM